VRPHPLPIELAVAIGVQPVVVLRNDSYFSPWGVVVVGCEPGLRADFPQLLRHAKARGLVTSLVTNGFRLDGLLDDHADALGRSRGDHVASSLRLAERCRTLGLRVKLNSVVSALTWDEDMSALVREMQPERWNPLEPVL